MRIPELLAPAGSYEAFLAAVNAGCDAVYLGGKRFGARANADNFTMEQLKQVISEAHTLGVKVYYTANTLIKEREMEAFLEDINFLYSNGIDAVIIQDMGVYRTLHDNFKDLPLHASTQMTIHSLLGVKYLENLGFERAVLSRELQLDEIRRIIDNTGIEIECFVHGALCYSYSGQCYFSSFIGGRSGNRGTCAQPCRLPYNFLGDKKRSHLLSPKDIETLSILPKLIETGIHSYKIEGRMKSPEYVGLITALYRKYIDLAINDPNNYKVDPNDFTNMQQIFNRGGFSNGYYLKKNIKQMMSPDKPKHQGVCVGKVVGIKPNSLLVDFSKDISQGDCLEINDISFTIRESVRASKHRVPFDKTNGISIGTPVNRLTDVKLLEQIEKDIVNNKRKRKVNGHFEAHVGGQLKLSITINGREVCALGDTVEKAKTSPMTEEQIKAQLTKTGNDNIEFEKLTLDIDEDIFIPVKSLNQIRRESIAKFNEYITASYLRKPVNVSYNIPKSVNHLGNPKLTVLIRSLEQFNVVVDYPVESIYAEMSSLSKEDIKEIALWCKEKNISLYLALPRIVRDFAQRNLLDKMDGIDCNGFLVRTIDDFAFINSKNIVVDYSMNITNQSHLDYWQELGALRICPSVELNKRELADLNANKEIVIYGYLPVMTTELCVSQGSSCSKGKPQIIVDRKQAQFYIDNNCDLCQNTIYNSVPLFLIDQVNQIVAMGSNYLRLEFLNEDETKIRFLMELSQRILNGGRIEDTQWKEKLPSYTRGHYERGVQ